MARIRSNNCFGTVTDNPLTNVATTLNSAGLANLAAVSGGDEAIITLDPNRVNGAPEIVRVTAHTGSATSATIDRGEFGTSAREHPQGTEWVHGPVAATSSDLDGDFGGFWEAYTPTNTAITVGNGTLTARFARVGKTVYVRWHLLLGSGSAVASGAAIGLPVAAHATGEQSLAAHYLDSGTRNWVGVAAINRASATTADLLHTESGGSGGLDATNPFTWTTSDEISVTGTYEAA